MIEIYGQVQFSLYNNLDFNLFPTELKNEKNAYFACLTEIFLSFSWAHFDIFIGLSYALNKKFLAAMAFGARLKMSFGNILLL